MDLVRLEKIAALTIILFGVGWLLYIGSFVILPVLFAIFLGLLLNPIQSRLHNLVRIRWISISLSFIVFLLPIIFIGTLLSMQLVDIINDLPSIEDKLTAGLEKILDQIRQSLPFLYLDTEAILSENIMEFLNKPMEFVKQGISATTTTLLYMSLSLIFAFFFLYYKMSFKNFIIYQAEKAFRPEVRKILSEIKKMVQAYLVGMTTVIIILSVLNSIGLFIIGVKYAIFWGVFAGLLTIIPYVGTTLGGLLPFLYTLATADYALQPLIVVGYYLAIQQIEGNLITPIIVGNRVDINPLMAILSLMIFGALWGIGGVILAFPIISIIKIIMEQFEISKPLAFLLSSEIHNAEIFKTLKKDRN